MTADPAAITLPISETFTSIQGEGSLTGTPSFFIRISGCNLRCTWCDTPYASWKPEADTRSLATLLDEARAANVQHVVLTGGEPMLFDAIEPLSQSLRANGCHITIETAGTIHRPPSKLACDLLSLSPKLSNSTPPRDDPRDPAGQWHERHEERRLNPGTLQHLIDDYPARQLKFVVASPNDLDEIDQLVDKLTNLEPTDIMLMPEGVHPPAPGEHDWIVNACTERNWRYCPRLHIVLFGNTRGT